MVDAKAWKEETNEALFCCAECERLFPTTNSGQHTWSLILERRQARSQNSQEGA